MKKLSKLFYVLTLFFLIISVFSCSNGDDSPVVPVSSLFVAKAEVPSMLNTKRDTGYDVSVSVDASAFDNATVFNKSLALASFFSAIESGSEKNITSFYQTIGFDNIDTKKSYGASEDMNSVSYCLAHRMINGYDVVAVTCQSVNYNIQWGGNLTIGATGEHEGFLESANTVYTALKKYIDDHYKTSYDGKKLKLWLTGYSRGGAITNVLSYLILGDATKKLAVENKNVFTYTFSTPRGLTKEHSIPYQNVFNLISEADPVTFVAPDSYGFGRCGTDKITFKSVKENYIEHKTVEKTPFSDYTKVTETYSYTTIVDEYLKALDPEISLSEFRIHKSSRREYNDGKINNVSTDEENYITEKDMTNWLFGLLMEKDGSAAGGYSFKTRELYASTVQDKISFFLKLFFANRPAFDLLINKVKENPMSALTWLTNEDGLYNDVKACLNEKQATYDDSKLKEGCKAVYTMTIGEGCLVPAISKILPLIIGGNKDFTRLIAMHYPEVQYVLIKNMAGQ